MIAAMAVNLASHFIIVVGSRVEGIAKGKAKLGGREDVAPLALRTTSILRPEDGTWKVVHRHADPITTVQAPESVIQK